MDIKITKKRLSNLISYDFLKIILACVAVIVVWSLLFTTLGTIITEGQQFYPVVFEGVNGYSDGNFKLLETLKKEGSASDGGSALSFDVLETSVTEIISAGSYSASYMLTVRLSAGEGDVIIIGGGNEEYDEESGNMSDLLSLVSNRTLCSIDKLLDSAYIYTVKNGFISETENGYEVDREKIKDFFITQRIPSARNYRRTYVDEKTISDGVENEIKRIEQIYLNYLAIKKAIENAKERGEDFLWYAKPVYIDGDNTVYGEENAYGIDIAKLVRSKADGEEDIKKLWYTFDENGNTTIAGLVFGVIDRFSEQSDLQYETLGALSYIIRTYSDYVE